VARLADGDEGALGPLYDRYGKIIYSLALRVVHDSATAEEVTQEVFVRLWRNAASFEPGRGRVHAWVLRIAHNLALNEVRRRQSRPVAADAFDWDVEGSTLVDQDTGGDPAMASWLHERATTIRVALAQLPSPQRQAIELAFFGGLSQAEVAAAMGDPLGTVKSRIRVGMQRLRDLLLAAGMDAQSIEV
jgi:RNA polymerase sigma-70 factor (ECF subfamily)